MDNTPYSIYTTFFSKKNFVKTVERNVVTQEFIENEQGEEETVTKSSVAQIDEYEYVPYKAYHGRCKDIYIVDDQWDEPYVALVLFSDRMQIENRTIASSIPYKGQINCNTTLFFAEQTKDIIANCYTEKIHQNILHASYCKPIEVEFIVRGYLTGRLWEYYKEGNREINGYKLDEGMEEFDKLPEPILTPTLKHQNYDYQVSNQDIIKSGLLQKTTLEVISDISIELYKFGSKYAESKGLALLDTMFEFGYSSSYKPILMDEILSIDHSRYISLDNLHVLQQGGQVELDFLPKLYLRKLFEQKRLEDNNCKKQISSAIFRGGIDFETVEKISNKYINLYNRLEINPPIDFTFQPKILAEMHEIVAAYY